MNAVKGTSTFPLRFLTGALAIGALALGCGPEGAAGGGLGSSSSALASHRPNNHPIQNPTGKDASYSTQGGINFLDQFFVPQGTNGRTCATCHTAEDGWSVRPETVQRFFDETDGTHPIFANNLDADWPTAPIGTVEERRTNNSMLLQGKFIRRVTIPATYEYTVDATSDPFGQSNATRLQFFRRPLPTANFLSFRVMWDGANTVGTDLRAGLIRQARGNVTGAQQGPPASDEVIDEIVDFELDVSNAQLIVPGVGRLDSDGARGGPEHRSAQALVNGPFDLYDAWVNHENPRRAQIARGQALFNTRTRPNGGTCRGCHNAANDGQSVNGTMFDVGASDPQWAKPDMAVFTLKNKETGDLKFSTDPGRGVRSGLWNDINRFKTPNLRGLAARPPYFHNGIAATLAEVVDFYEASLGFDFSEDEEADLVAFLNAL